MCVLVGVFCTVAQHGQSYEWNAGLQLSCWLVVFLLFVLLVVLLLCG